MDEEALAVCEFLTSAGLTLAWRPTRLLPDDFSWQFCDDGSLHLGFDLVAGGYATALLAECLQYKNGAVREHGNGVVNRMDLHGIGMTSRRTRERLVQRLLDQGINDSVVLDVMRTTPRHLFLDEAMAHRAYEDVALPIGHQQTLSQPYVVARMTELLMASGPRQRVLEIGTGSGYQTAVLAQLVGEVYSVERIKPLQQKARQRLRQLQFAQRAV